MESCLPFLLLLGYIARAYAIIRMILNLNNINNSGNDTEHYYTDISGMKVIIILITLIIIMKPGTKR